MTLHTLAALLQAQVPGTAEHRISDIFKPMAGPASSEANIAKLTIAITAAIFFVVGTLIVYTIVKFRRKPEHDMQQQEPPQIYGSNQIEAAWTVIPILIVFVLIGVTARVVASVQNASPPKSTLKIRVIGLQWWWEVQYPDYKITTANEVHMIAGPDGQVSNYIQLQSADVAHSFWIPQLAGKTDLIPNRDNYIWMDPREPGVYVGNCAEYCGTQHANMLLRVIAQTPNDFEQWAAKEKEPAVEDPQAATAKATFLSLSCVNCHTVSGTSARGKFGPDLTHLMTRQTLASNMIVNNPENLKKWVNDPQEMKQGCLMPSFKLTDQELNQVVSYLETLK
jgi:cytochrome c oxidase subunit 2